MYHHSTLRVVKTLYLSNNFTGKWKVNITNGCVCHLDFIALHYQHKQVQRDYWYTSVEVGETRSLRNRVLWEYVLFELPFYPQGSPSKFYLLMCCIELYLKKWTGQKKDTKEVFFFGNKVYLWWLKSHHESYLKIGKNCTKSNQSHQDESCWVKSPAILKL